MRKLFRRLSSFAINRIPVRIAEKLVAKLERKLGIGSGAHILSSGEILIFDIVCKLSSSAVVLFDVGANIGNYAKIAIENLPTELKHEVHCFEPSPTSFEKLKIKFAGSENVIVNSFALGAAKETASLYMNTESSRLASLTKRDLDHHGIKHDNIVVEVDVQTLDCYASERKIESIDLLKIDVEGHEMDVLIGAQQLIDQGAIKLVQFEFGGCNIDTRSFFRDFYFFLEGKGYHLYRILPKCHLLKIPAYRETEERFLTSNYLAVRNEIDLSEICRDIIV
jgi:FkbM family methyltransferase